MAPRVVNNCSHPIIRTPATILRCSGVIEWQFGRSSKSDGFIAPMSDVKIQRLRGDPRFERRILKKKHPQNESSTEWRKSVIFFKWSFVCSNVGSGKMLRWHFRQTEYTHASVLSTWAQDRQPCSAYGIGWSFLQTNAASKLSTAHLTNWKNRNLDSHWSTLDRLELYSFNWPGVSSFSYC